MNGRGKVVVIPVLNGSPFCQAQKGVRPMDMQTLVVATADAVREHHGDIELFLILRVVYSHFSAIGVTYPFGAAPYQKGVKKCIFFIDTMVAGAFDARAAAQAKDYINSMRDALDQPATGFENPRVVVPLQSDGSQCCYALGAVVTFLIKKLMVTGTVPSMRCRFAVVCI